MIKVLINGCNGKMGQEVAKKVDYNDNMLLIGGFDISDNGVSTFPIYTDTNDIYEIPDVIIDFSIPTATLNILEFANKNNIPMVIATTGFDEKQIAKIESYSKNIPIFKSANMSFDINLIAKILKIISPSLSDTDIEIVETHHHRKIDAPSGTALFLADTINDSLNNSMKYTFDRHSKRERRQKNEIGISAIRGGNIVGEHSIFFFGENETLEIKHTSHSRTVFADGAIKAAEFIINKPAGMYNMEDLV